MIKVKFKHTLYGQEFSIIASAKDVDSYGAMGLKLKFVDKSGEQVDIIPDRNSLDELQELASELLYERKYLNELEF